MIRPRASSATAVVFDDKLIGNETSGSTYIDSRGIHERNPTFREFIQVKVVDSDALLGNISQLVVFEFSSIGCGDLGISGKQTFGLHSPIRKARFGRQDKLELLTS
jgi:hypothetical protein